MAGDHRGERNYLFFKQLWKKEEPRVQRGSKSDRSKQCVSEEAKLEESIRHIKEYREGDRGGKDNEFSKPASARGKAYLKKKKKAGGFLAVPTG